MLRLPVTSMLRAAKPRVAMATKSVASKQQVCRSSVLAVHRDTPDNNPSIPFEYTEANKIRADEAINRFPLQYKKAAVLPLLDIAQRQNDNFLSISAMNYVAKYLELPPMRVYEVATFYTMFNRQRIGKYHIEVCTTTPCQLSGSDAIIDALQKKLGIKVGETTKDKMFTLNECECQGACQAGPMIACDDKFYEDLTPETVVNVVEKLIKGEEATPGPQSGRHSCEPKSGQKTLLNKEPFNVAELTRADL